jgi:hypothetical protein
MTLADTTYEVAGYRSCRACPEAWVLESDFVRTGGVCVKCWLAGITIHQLEVRSGTATIPVRPRDRPKRRNRGRDDTARLAELARRRAKSRLTAMHPADYEVLLAQERAALGLRPLPPERQPTKTIDYAAVYDRLATIGER